MTEAGSTDWQPRGQASSPETVTAEEKALQQLKLTRDEVRVLKECNRESFWYRCVPLSLMGMATTQLAINRGMVAPHSRYGSAFKLVAAGFAGYIVGKVSYTRTCKEKLMKLENSPLAESLRNQKYGRSPPRWAQRSEMSDTNKPQFPADTDPTESDYQSKFSSADSNVQNKGLDDTFRPNLDSVPTLGSGQFPSPTDALPAAELTEEKSQLSYQDLRRVNREEYNKRMQVASSPPPSPPLARGQARPGVDSPPRYSTPQQPRTQQPGSDQPRLGGYKKPAAKNQYGDDWDEH